MAYENINTTSLKSAITSCRNSINYTTGKEFIKKAGNIWQSDSKDKLVSCLNTLYDVRFKELNNKLNSYYTAACCIEQYQKTQGEISSLRSEINTLNGKLWYDEKYDVKETSWYEDDEGKWHEKTETVTKTRRVKDTNIESQINTKNNQISDKEKTLTSLSNQINNLI